MDRFSVISFLTVIVSLLCACSNESGSVSGDIRIDNTPVLALKKTNNVGFLTLKNRTDEAYVIKSVEMKLKVEENLSDISNVCLSSDDKEIFSVPVSSSRVRVSTDIPVSSDSVCFRLGIGMKDSISLSNRISVESFKIKTDKGTVTFDCKGTSVLRTGVALRQRYQDGVDNCRIPGLVTTASGTLLAMYDARRDADRDLQGDIDICYNRSTDGGRTWSEMMTALDMGEYGGLPQKYNGVSDGSMLVDTNAGDIYVTGLWMHGILDPKTGKFVEGLTEESTEWNHQWRSFGSQPGYDIHRSCQFLMAKSTDDGLTWSAPVNITRQVKPESFWLMAPAPGAGTVLEDGTLMFPAEGRTETGLQFSTIIYSRDGGENWIAGKPAFFNTNECMAVQLSDGSIMLNARERSNRNKKEGNGRKIAVTSDMGETWTIHPTSQNALIEPACQGSLLKHVHTDADGNRRQLIFFFNPSSISRRENFTLKCSLDDGMTWPEELWIQMDSRSGEGYSCMTMVDDDTIGILYEGSGANMVFQCLSVSEILDRIENINQ